MIKVLIVDDEVLVKVGLKTCISWEENGFCIVGEANNGVQGLDLCKHLKPDIILCDIKMPVMNGVELIRTLKKDYPELKIIVLSGYDDYEYVRETMKLGVVDYILKLSLKPEELLNMLLNLKEQIGDERLKSSIKDSDQEYCSSMMHISDIFTKVIGDELLTAEEEDFFRKKMPFLYTGQYFFMCMKIDKYLDILKLSRMKNEGEFNLAVCNIIKQVLKPFGDCEIISFGKGAYTAVLSGRCVAENNFYEICNALNESLLMYNNISISTGISNLHMEAGNMKSAYCEAYTALGHRFYNGKSGIEVYGKMKSELDASIIIFDKEVEKKLFHTLEIFDKDGSVKCIDELFNNIEDSRRAMPEKVKEALREIVFTCNRVIKYFNLDIYQLLDTNAQRIDESIGELEFLADCRMWVLIFLEKLFNRIINNKLLSHREEIYRIREYILMNYNKQMNLESIADLVNMNKNYLSNLFSKETGMGFSEYLTGIRIEKAKELLKGNKIKIFDVAIQVGFNDEHYFSKVFKKVTGKSPADYKKFYENKKIVENVESTNYL